MANERANVVPLASPAPARKPVVGFARADSIQIQPIDWLIDGWIAKDSLAGLVGPSGSCKSFLAIDWACRVATGTPWNGCDVQRGAVFVIAGEGRNGLRKRIEGWSFHTGVSIEGAPLFIASTMPPLADGFGGVHVIAEIEELTDELFFNCGGIEPSLIVIDTVARAMAGKNENSAQDVGELIACMDLLRDRWGATVLAVHHTGHDASGRARGSSSFYAALDSEVLMKPRANALELKQTKAKDWQPPHPILLKPSPVFVTVPGTDTQTTTLVLMNGGKAERPADRDGAVRELREQGLSVRAIGKELEMSKSAVERALKRLGEEVEP
ncbi:hypothetical protein GCM10008101_06810 [Lysobacter xinjiangensis]|uniref:AAA domain-containing protein n=1 Tax=Cognatilysobacter xinjiangensis TaxID=546892 RepID=A0ABQ3BSC8_9GAMM|nr:AAA family ATPase [Lysobacter xinjiangensis]GGZ56043.1 hypothetical protein GCM10008101_06810 [Lysobacter xinjiangensis]